MEKNTVLLIEPRILDIIPSLITEYYKHLGDNWNYVFYCGKDTSCYWKPKVEKYVEIRELNVYDFPLSNQYNDFMKQRIIWESLYGEYVLTIQTDTWPTNIPPYSINYFINLNKSYIGGNMEYIWNEFKRDGIHIEPRNFNGGLSLRKRNDMIRIIDKFPPEPTMWLSAESAKMETDAEDCYFTMGCYKLGLPIGDDFESSHFAIHSIYRDKFFGIHQPCNDFVANKLIRNHINLRNKNPHLKLNFPTMKIFYRYSDSINNKGRPFYFSKEKCLRGFIERFKDHSIYIIADNVSDETLQFLSNYVNKDNIIRTCLHNAKSFLFSVRVAIDNFNDDDKIYLVEDDYLHTKDASWVIEEGLDIADYVSGYDHYDKYINYNETGPNPYISEGGEETRVILSNNRHWKLTNSCCMTFATRVKTLKEDYSIYEEFCQNNIPEDFQMFIKLRSKGRKLISCIPAVSTHCESKWLAPFIDWEKET